MNNGLPIYVDIDGTLTEDGYNPNGSPINGRIDALKRLIEKGISIVIWSARGQEYAQMFVNYHDFTPHAVLGKPSMIIDDQPSIRPNLQITQPDFLDKIHE